MKQSSEHHTAHKFGMAIDLDKCTGCGACMVACMAENDVPFKEDESNKLDSITWMRVYRLTNGKPFPDAEICYLPRPCQHCEGHAGHSPCVSVCPARPRPRTMTPTRASSARSTHVVSGAGTVWRPVPTMRATSTGGIRSGLGGDGKILEPQCNRFACRGVVEKCSFCIQRYQLAKEKAYGQGRRQIAEDEYQTACTQACPAGAITFGDLNNPEHAVHQLVRPDPHHGGRPLNPLAFRLLERLGTNPKVYYLSSREWVRNAGDNYLEHEKSTG